MVNQGYDEILRSTTRLARLTFAAAASSIFLYDQERNALVFEASSGVGEDQLVGVEIPHDQGIAGWVLRSGEPIVVRGASDDSRFDRDFAAQTGLVPEVIMAAPVEHDGEILGVLEVLDPQLESVGDISSIDMLTELATQSCAALRLLTAERKRAAMAGAGSQAEALAELLGAGSDARREFAVTELLSAVSKLMSS
jgi:signal transduction protein with GAF and PtsI domain